MTTTCMRTPMAGLVPFYLKLYDDVQPERPDGLVNFPRRIADGLAARGINVRTMPICRVAGEFNHALRDLESEGAVDCVITLHLAYSPSLEALDAFLATTLPIIILDTTVDADFGLDAPPDRIFQNHGIHGVMDFASMLRRNRRGYEIVAGHDSDPRVLDRVAATVRAAVAARAFRNTRAVRIGNTFEGMGDFHVEEGVLKSRLGIATDQVGIDALDREVQRVSDGDVAREMALDRDRFECRLDAAVHERSVRTGLGLRHFLETGGYQAMSVNFQSFDRADRPANVMPFLEISKAMSRGIGYAGEGDVLTAALVGALMRVFGAVTFTEIFCPDWRGNRLFLSHMGEINPALADKKPRVTEKPFLFGGALNPAVLTCAVRPGPATFVNLAPGPDNSFTLITAPVDVLAENDSLHEAMRDTVRIWVRPPTSVTSFLESYSRLGGTHHSALLMGDHRETIAAFGRMNGLHMEEITP